MTIAVFTLWLFAADQDGSEKLWRQSLSSNPDAFEANFNLGLLHYRRKQMELAEPLLARAAAANPKHFDSAYLLGAVRSQQGKVDEALLAWRKALTLQPNNRKLMRIMAVEYRKGGYFRDAADVAEKAIEANDEPSWILAIRASHAAADSTRSLKLAKAFVAAHPASPAASLELGYALFRSGDLTGAEPLLARASSAPEASEEAFQFYGEVLAARNEQDAAIAAFRNALKLRPEYTGARLALARALTTAGRQQDAKRELLEAIRLDPQHPQPHTMLSQILFREGDEDGAGRHRGIAQDLRRKSPSTTEGQQSRPFPAPVR